MRDPRPQPPLEPADPLAGLSAADREVVREEEALLVAVQRALAVRRAARHDGEELTERLKELREEAMESTEEDLPTVFQEMGLVRAVLERDRAGPLPDARAPYFAHLRIRDAHGVRDYGLGRATFVDRGAGIRVVDWRHAPVAELFYRYREGEEFEETLAGKPVRGVVEARRVVVLAGGRLVRVALADGELRRTAAGGWERAGADFALRGGSGTAARDGSLGVGAGAAGRASAEVTALLDPDQYAAVTAPADRPLLVVGSAGSGKTTVALHRLSRIAFADPRRYPPSRIAVVVPEVGLARLAGRLLGPLGQEKVAIRTVDQWARGAFQSAFATPPPRLCAEPPALVTRLKRHPALHETLRRRPRPVGSAPNLRALRRDLSDLLVDEGFLGKVVAAAAGDLPTTAIAETVRHTRLQLAPPPEQALEGIDPERLQTLDGLSVSDGTPESLGGTLDPEDLVLLLFLRALRREGAGARRLAHLVLDEAEDLSLFECAVLGQQLDGGRSVTVAGDESQRTATGHAGWLPALAALGVEDAAEVRLATTYRCPRPVAELAHQLLGPLAPPEPASPGRDGAPVGRFAFPAEAHAQLFLAGALRDLVEREPEASVAVIAHAPHVARSVHRLLADLPEARLVLDGRFGFTPGIDVTDVESAKGLEWDYVVVPDASVVAYPDTDEARRRLHVAVTRAAHQLWVASVGTPTPLLAPPAP